MVVVQFFFLFTFFGGVCFFGRDMIFWVIWGAEQVFLQFYYKIKIVLGWFDEQNWPNLEENLLHNTCGSVYPRGGGGGGKCMIIHIEFEVFTFIISIFLSHYFESNNGFKLKTSCWLRQRYLLHMAVSNVRFKKQYRDSP